MFFRSFFWSLAAAGLLASFQAHAAVTAEIPVEYSNGYLWLKVQPAGEQAPLDFILDSGAAASVLDLGAARRLKAKLGRQVPVQGVHSRTNARRVDRFDARVGTTALPGSLLAIDLGAVSRACNRRIDGLLGADFFQGRIVQIDFPAGKLRILDQAPTGGGWASLPLKRCNGTFSVPVGVAGRPPQWMRVDTGCDSALEWVVGEAGKQAARGVSIGLANARNRSVVAEVQLGGQTLTGIKTGVHEQRMFPGESGLLGNALLARFRVTIDVPGGQLLLAYRYR